MATLSGPSAPLIREIERQITAALAEMFARAEKDGRVKDHKDQLRPPLPLEGLVQDCEFGMILLLARSWLRKRNVLPSNLVDETKVQRIVVDLVEKTARTLLNPKNDDAGGEYGDGDVVFFTGSPYTRRQRVDGFSANLDSAMLVLGFFAPALKEYHADLFAMSAPGTPPEGWIHNLRDLALYICKTGVEYAEKCQVRLSEKGFAGFSCDPKSLTDEDDDNTPYLEPFDRLFFTWTASETVRDLLEWVKGLDDIANGVPSEQTVAMRKGIQRLRAAVEEAAVWCEREFLETFRALESVPVANVVREIEPLGAAKLRPEQAKRVEQVASYVQHVYHLSQYAAIRSLSPAQVTVKEVGDICDRLHNLVADDILKSRLDASPQATLFRTLTRKYKLGVNIAETYDDDAYYPLVVRSMAGLLTRTMDRLGAKADRTAISKLVIDFRRVLREHHKNLVERRPKDAADGALWSFAAEQPYILYATQRTIFALLEYADFLDKMDEFEQQEDSDEVLEAGITSLLSQSLVENVFGKAIKQIVSMAKAQGGQARGAAEAALPLPKAEWAAAVIRQWLGQLAHAFDETDCGDSLTQRAEALLASHRWLRDVPDVEGDGKLRMTLTETRAAFQSMLEKYGLAGSTAPTPEDLRPHLFQELFEVPPMTLAEWKRKQTSWETLLRDAETLAPRLRAHDEKSQAPDARDTSSTK